MNTKRWMLALAASAALGVFVLPLSCGDYYPCEADLDCFIVCECAGLAGTITVGPYTCRFDNCGASHYRDMDCDRPCEDASPVPYGTFGDDDSADDNDPGDDDSGDDDSGDDDSGR